MKEFWAILAIVFLAFFLYSLIEIMLKNMEKGADEAIKPQAPENEEHEQAREDLAGVYFGYKFRGPTREEIKAKYGENRSRRSDDDNNVPHIINHGFLDSSSSFSGSSCSGSSSSSSSCGGSSGDSGGSSDGGGGCD